MNRKSISVLDFLGFSIRLSVVACILLLHFNAYTFALACSFYPSLVIEKNGKHWSLIDNMEMIYIPAGLSYQGSDIGRYDEKPLHKVKLDAFFIDIHEVTNVQFAGFVQATGYVPQGPWLRGYNDGEDLLPARYITWYDAKTYAEWAGKRLPTEAEWEKAARGTGEAVFPWGDNWNPQVLFSISGPNPVGTNRLDVSPYGCFDMGGNVFEWVNDWYDRYYYETFSDDIAINPQGPPDGAKPEEKFIKSGTAAGNERSTRKVIKSGGWQASLAKDNMRVANRMWANPNYWLNDTGFRCAVSAIKQE